MRSPFVYFSFGILFSFVAFTNVINTVWNAVTISLLLLASLEFYLGFRFLKLNLKKQAEQKRD